MKQTNRRVPPQVVCFGMVTPVAILVVDQLPPHNTGALVKHVAESIFDDASIVACLLSQWKVRADLIGTTIGNDARGKEVARQLKALGVRGKVRLSNHIKTPFEVDVSDRTGARTYFWQRDPSVLRTLDSADLSPLKPASLLYVDWYDGDHILRAMNSAQRSNVPVFLNLEHGHQDSHALSQYVPRCTICQANTDAAQADSAAAGRVADTLLKAGAQIAIITLAGEGCLVACGQQKLRVRAPRVQVLDGCGAGAVFSTGFIYGWLRGWELGECARFATAAASLKVARVGLAVSPISRVKRLASELTAKSIK